MAESPFGVGTATATSGDSSREGKAHIIQKGRGMRGRREHQDDESTVTTTCIKHWSERAVAQCHDCQNFWCADCLVPPLKKSQPLRCIESALVAAGIRGKGPRSQPMMNMNSTRKRSITSG